jgi:hypothetical protein
METSSLPYYLENLINMTNITQTFNSTYNMDVSVKCENLRGRTPFGRVRNKWEDNIKKSLKKHDMSM